MPKRLKYKFESGCDLKLLDYANARLPKSEDGIANRVSKSTNKLLVRETKNWFDCDLADFDEEIEEEEENEDSMCVTLKKCTKKRKHKRKEDEEGRIDASIYPKDLWFLIARAIPPADVARFALMCRPTFQVVESISYWKGLYNRHFVPTIDLPPNLMPGSLNRVYGLKTLVVQSLFHMYPSFKTRVKSNKGVHLRDEDLTKLSCAVCISSWHEKKTEGRDREIWTFYFKFRHLDYPDLQCDYDKCGESLDDIKTNLEMGCFVLKVSSSLYCPLPSVLSLLLKEVTFPLSRDMRSYKIKLRFRSSGGVKTCKDGGRPVNMGIVVDAVLDGVTHVDILNWWHPNYTHKLI